MQSEKTEKQVVFVLGGPGCGKGTQCSELVKAFGFVHLSAGELLREEIKKQSERGQMINEIIKDGRIVPSEITVELLKIAVESADQTKKMFIIDGFPRNQENYDVWAKIIGDSIELKFVLVLDCSYVYKSFYKYTFFQEAMEKRVLKRAESEARSDDNLETLKRRFSTFEKETMPIIKLYENTGLLRKVNAERSIPEIFDDVKTLF